MRLSSCLSLLSIVVLSSARCDEPRRGLSDIEDVIRDLHEADLIIPTSIGVTRKDTAIRAVITAEDLDYQTRKTRILLVAGAAGDRPSVDAALASVRWFYKHDDAAPYRDRFVLSAIPCTNPDGLANDLVRKNGPEGAPGSGYPPTGTAYNSTTDPESAYVWRWVGMHAPDFVVELVSDSKDQVRIAADSLPPSMKIAQAIGRDWTFAPEKSLTAQLASHPPCDTGKIPAIQLSYSSNSARSLLPRILDAMTNAELAAPSDARNELSSRLGRSPTEIKNELLKHYGKQLTQIVYIQSLAVIGRMKHQEFQLSDLGHEPDYAAIEEIVSVYFSGKKTASLKSGSDLSGHLVFSELALRFEGEKRQRYIELARRAADLAFNEDGSIKPSMPFHNEMSDALFMGGPILAQVGKLTSEAKYFDACIKHLRFMRELDWRDDGLYRHSPLDKAAWGRGNGFPAIGVAMCLEAIPPDHPGRQELLEAFQRHMAVLAKHQDPNGSWHQVIDHPESYREFTCTCMITYAMLRGVSEGWLDAATYEPVIKRAWYAIRTRIGNDGELVDVCTGTGKQKSLRDYYDRKAILGRDDRGGAMALLVANEYERWIRKLQANASREDE